jgi:protein-S-isoprenylcysteine O-methyltransferase Ste14
MATSMPTLRAEERFLHERFGAPYDHYTRRVRRWL